MRLSVWKTRRRRICTSPIMSMNQGSMWPTSGAAMARYTRGSMHDGPGVSISLAGGSSSPIGSSLMALDLFCLAEIFGGRVRLAGSPLEQEMEFACRPARLVSRIVERGSTGKGAAEWGQIVCGVVRREFAKARSRRQIQPDLRLVREVKSRDSQDSGFFVCGLANLAADPP